MRVGVDASFLAPESLHTGMGVYAAGLIRGLAALDAAEIILLGYGRRPTSAPREMGWCSLPQLPVGRLSPWLSHQLVLPRVAARLRLDVLHITGVNLRLSRPGVPLTSPCPLVVTLHDVIPLVYYGRLGPPLPRRLALAYHLALLGVRRADAVITVSESSRRDILEHLPLDGHRVRAIHNGLDFAPPADPGRASSLLAQLGVTPPYLLYAGSYEPRKNLLGTLAAYGLALRQRALPPLVVLVERDSGHRTAAMAEIERSGFADRLILLHSLDDELLAALYAGADLLVHPSLYEGFGFVPLQAMACGVPVISSPAGALSEVLGNAAVYVDPSLPTAVASAILDLIDSPERQSELRARGRAQAARYRWETAAAATLETYRRVAPGLAGDNAELDRINSIRWFHSIELPTGVTPGHCPPSVERWVATAIPRDLHGASVLDVGAWDGYFSFEAERRGASRVLAIDSLQGPRRELGTAGFECAKALLDSRTEFRVMDVFDLGELDESFDLILFLGVYYHLVDPVRAFEILYRRLRPGGTLLIEGLVVPGAKALLRAYQPTDFEETTYCAATPAWFEIILAHVGFTDVHLHGGTWRPTDAMQYYADRFSAWPSRLVYVMANWLSWQLGVQRVPFKQHPKAYRGIVRAVRPLTPSA